MAALDSLRTLLETEIQQKVDNIETMVTETNTAVVQVKQSQAEMMQKLDNIEVMMNGLCVRGPIRRGEGGGLNGSASSEG